jgi:CubicO group peptidase (beta-lactamase class C family)
MSRTRSVVWPALTVGLLALTAACGSQSATGGTKPGVRAAQAAAIREIVRQTMTEQRMQTAIVSVKVDGKEILTEAYGDTLPGIPATTDMSFRSGAVAFAYIGNLLLQLVDDGTVRLDDPISRWMPELPPPADQVTLLMLANQTAGYPDFEQDPAWVAAYYADPFHSWTFEERLAYVLAEARPFAPGANWSYSHSNFMILGEVLSRIGKKPLATMLQDRVLKPLHLRNTVESPTSSMPSPFLHSFSAERRKYFAVPAATSFYEEETFWNTQWGSPMGANETSTIGDLVDTAIAIGEGKLLSDASYHAMTDPNLLGFGHTDPGCVPECFPQTEAYNFGVGVVRSGGWIKQNPVLTGYAAVEAYLPSKRIAIAVANTFTEAYFSDPATASNPSNTAFEKIAAYLAPGDAPPTRS